MALKIINTQNTFKVEGELNSTTANNFDIHFTSLLKSIMNLTVDLSKVSHINTDGKQSIDKLRKYAKVFKRKFKLILTQEQELILGIAA